jgi:Cdc6-like AAA superfamily ATPase
MFNDARLVKYGLLERNKKTRANKSVQVFQCSLNCIDYSKLKDCITTLYNFLIGFVMETSNSNIKFVHSFSFI